MSKFIVFCVALTAFIVPIVVTVAIVSDQVGIDGYEDVAKTKRGKVLFFTSDW